MKKNLKLFFKKKKRGKFWKQLFLYQYIVFVAFLEITIFSSFGERSLYNANIFITKGTLYKSFLKTREPKKSIYYHTLITSMVSLTVAFLKVCLNASKSMTNFWAFDLQKALPSCFFSKSFINIYILISYIKYLEINYLAKVIKK